MVSNGNLLFHKVFFRCELAVGFREGQFLEDPTVGNPLGTDQEQDLGYQALIARLSEKQLQKFAGKEFRPFLSWKEIWNLYMDRICFSIAGAYGFLFWFSWIFPLSSFGMGNQKTSRQLIMHVLVYR